MAANLAKWWKTKILNGYRQFTVVPTDCSEGRPSDTEELLGRQDKDHVGEQSLPPEPPRQRQLNFEEFECDLSVEGGGQERQEFSFTLYDFDGHGKITKDDIAGLVTTIYDTLGSSIKVPHYGSKTIKVKLTVSPDQRKKDVSPPPPQQPQPSHQQQRHQASQSQPSPSRHRVKFKRDLNVTIQESSAPSRTRGRQRREWEKYPNSCSSSCRSDNNEDRAAEASEDDDEDEELLPSARTAAGESQHSTPKASRESGRTRTRRYQQHTQARYRHHNGIYCPGESSTLRQRSKKRSSSLQREELLQIIQANMEKNNLHFQTARKTCGDRGDQRHGHHRHRHKDVNSATVQLHYLTDFPQQSSCYLDLAGLEHHPGIKRCLAHQDCHYDKFLGAMVCSSSKHSGYHQQCGRQRGHHRSRSHDLSAASSFQYHLLDPGGGTGNYYQPPRVSTTHHARSKSHEVAAAEGRIFVAGHSSSPHYLKHQNREQDQQRAMAQVVRWLEQEFSSSLNTSEQHSKPPPPASPKGTSKPQSTPGCPKKEEQPTPKSPTSSSVERHEHHHVHEHIHHHYHHYQETPVLV